MFSTSCRPSNPDSGISREPGECMGGDLQENMTSSSWNYEGHKAGAPPFLDQFKGVQKDARMGRVERGNLQAGELRGSWEHGQAGTLFRDLSKESSLWCEVDCMACPGRAGVKGPQECHARGGGWAAVHRVSYVG